MREATADSTQKEHIPDQFSTVTRLCVRGLASWQVKIRDSTKQNSDRTAPSKKVLSQPSYEGLRDETPLNVYSVQQQQKSSLAYYESRRDPTKRESSRGDCEKGDRTEVQAPQVVLYYLIPNIRPPKETGNS